jgi:hypothetical protein
MNTQPGTGYTFTNLGSASSLEIDLGFKNWALPSLDIQKHPYQIYYESGTEFANSYLIKVYPGTTQGRDTMVFNFDQNDVYLTNNPAPFKTVSSSSLSKNGWFYIQVEGAGSGSGYAWPSDAPIKIVLQNWDGESPPNIPENDDDNLYIPVGYYRSEGTGAEFKIIEVVNVVQTSLWTERFKCGNNPAEFFVARA